MTAEAHFKESMRWKNSFSDVPSGRLEAFRERTLEAKCRLDELDVLFPSVRSVHIPRNYEFGPT